MAIAIGIAGIISITSSSFRVFFSVHKTRRFRVENADLLCPYVLIVNSNVHRKCKSYIIGTYQTKSTCYFYIVCVIIGTNVELNIMV